MRRLVRNPMIQYIIISLITKYDYSSLHDFTEIFDEKFHYSKYGKKENQINTEKNKHEKAGSQSHSTIHHYQPAYQIWLLYLARFHTNFWRKTSLFKVWKEKKNNCSHNGQPRQCCLNKICPSLWSGVGFRREGTSPHISAPLQSWLTYSQCLHLKVFSLLILN